MRQYKLNVQIKEQYFLKVPISIAKSLFKSFIINTYFYLGQTNKYWNANDEGVSVESDVPEGFFIELREPTRICIKSVTGYYLSAGKNGMFRLGDGDYNNATKWEY